MTDLPMQFRPDPDLSGQARGVLPDAPLAMPTQCLERPSHGWAELLTAPLRLLRLPLSRGA